MNNLKKEPKYLKKTVEAILELKKETIRAHISVRNIRRLKGIDGTDRSAVMFYRYSLTFLEREGIITVINHSSPKKYAVIDEEKLISIVEGLNF